MIVSLEYLKNLVGVDLGDRDQLCELIGSRLVEVESVNRVANKYSGAVIVRVVECVDHTNSDHLHVCKIDDAGVIKDVERDADGLVQVVCGAPNVHSGMLAVWLPPKTIVPETYATDDEFQLASRKLRGVMSHGMLASCQELDLGADHSGILEVDEETAVIGDNLGEVLDLKNDFLLEVENKSLTHRPDCFGMIGFGREVAAISGQKPAIPKWFDVDFAYRRLTKFKGDFQIKIDIDGQLCQRYTCLAIDYDGAGKTDLYTKSILHRLGIKSIDYIVDATNIVMMETGQPLHAYDLDKLIAISPTGRPDLVVRAASSGETLKLIDGREIELTAHDIVVAVGDQSNSVPVALAGAMGGANTEIDDSSRRILLESATFDLYRLRATQFRHGVFTEAITRFTKGLPPKLAGVALARVASELVEGGHAKVISKLSDWEFIPDWQPDPNSKLEKFVKKYEGKHSLGNVVSLEISRNLGGIEFVTSLISETIGKVDGKEISLTKIKTVLENLGYSDIDCDEDTIDVEIPWWRTDLRIPQDVIEDIGRVLGYDNIDKALPSRKYVATPLSDDMQVDRLLCSRMLRAGANEVMTYSFVHGDLLTKVGDNTKEAYRIVNAISPDLQFYRRDLLPSLVNIAGPNIKAGYNDFCLFEIGKVHRRGVMDRLEPELPAEIRQLSALVVATDDNPYYLAKKIFDYLLGDDGGRYNFIRLDRYDKPLDSSVNIYEPCRAARVEDDNGQLIGYVGELRKSVRRAFKLPDGVAGFTVYLDQAAPLITAIKAYTPVQRYQGTTRDVTIATSDERSYSQVLACMRSYLDANAEELDFAVSPLDIYQPAQGQINYTYRIVFHDKSKTVDIATVNQLMAGMSEAVQSFGKII